MCGRKYMFFKGRIFKMFSDESVKMFKYRWYDIDYEKVNLKLFWNFAIMFLKEGEFMGREFFFGFCIVVSNIKSCLGVCFFLCVVLVNLIR